IGAERGGGDIPCAIKRSACGATFGMEAGRIGVLKVAKGGCDLAQHRRGSGVVEVDASHVLPARTAAPTS
ncbi:MAG TPA: hypothetical protein VIP78_16375, partial [Candidatus Dormibacteraeota bacterium]